MNKINLVRARKKSLPIIYSIIRILFLSGIAYVILYPLMTKFVLLFMDFRDIRDFSVTWIPKHFTLENVRLVIEIIDYWESLAISIGACLLLASLQVFVTTISAYGLARYKSKIRDIIFFLVVGTLIIPPQTYLTSLYIQFKNFDPFGMVSSITGTDSGINDTIFTLVMMAVLGVGIRSGLYIYVQRQTFRGLPIELEEAATVDGAGTFSTFFRIMLPNARPTIVLCFILSFIWQWNDTMYTSLFYPNLKTLAMRTGSLVADMITVTGGWGAAGNSDTLQLTSIGAFLCVFPLILLFVLCQKFFVQGVERSGLVG